MTHTAIDLGAGAAVAVTDVGGTEIKTSVLDGAGRLGPVIHLSTPQGPDVVERVLDVIAAQVNGARSQHEIEAVGLVVPGIVDAARGIAVLSENLGWRQVPFADLVADRIGLPVGFGHDVATAGRAEVEFGAGAGYANVAVIVVGTGISAALFVDGEPLTAGGWAGELGHSVVDRAGPVCVCGARGCLEAIASSAAIARRYSTATGTDVPGSREVLQRLHAGDAAAATVWTEAIDALAAGIRQLSALLSPDLVIIGGGIVRAGDDLLAPLRAAVQQTVPPLRVPQLRVAAIGPYASLVGAAGLGRAAAMNAHPDAGIRPEPEVAE